MGRISWVRLPGHWCLAQKWMNGVCGTEWKLNKSTNHGMFVTIAWFKYFHAMTLLRVEVMFYFGLSISLNKNCVFISYTNHIQYAWYISSAYDFVMLNDVANVIFLLRISCTSISLLYIHINSIKMQKIACLYWQASESILAPVSLALYRQNIFPQTSELTNLGMIWQRSTISWHNEIIPLIQYFKSV